MITGGLVNWLAPTPEGGGEFVLRMRKGDVIAAQDAIIGAPRSATVVASDPHDGDGDRRRGPRRGRPTLSPDPPERHPDAARAHASARACAAPRSSAGEEVGLVAGPSVKDLLPWLVAAARSATPRPVTVLDRRLSVAGALTASDELAAENATVLILGELDPKTMGVMLDEVDRVVALAGTAEEAELLRDSAGSREGSLEIVLVGGEAERERGAWSPRLPSGGSSGLRAPERLPASGRGPRLARPAPHPHQAGVALGAGGAKGYAHVGVLRVLEEAGYTVDYIGGTSIGGFVSTQIAMGYNAQQIDERFRGAFDEELVGAMFSGPFGGGPGGPRGARGHAQARHRGALVLRHADPADDHGRRPERPRAVPSARGPDLGGAAGRAGGRWRVPTPGAQRPPARGRHRAGPRADGVGARGRSRRRRLREPDERGGARPLAGRPGARGRAGQEGRACSTRSSRRWT